MKKVAGTLKLDQAQYRELEAFSKFGSDLDPATKRVLEKGEKNTEILKQGQYQPMPIEMQVAIIWLGVEDLLHNIPLDKLKVFEKEYLDFLGTNEPDTLKQLKEGNLTDEIKETLKKVATEIAEQYQ
jgi:F-type H+-transporting ATPase subunit alpha